jgi:hypothetical protein
MNCGGKRFTDRTTQGFKSYKGFRSEVERNSSLLGLHARLGNAQNIRCPLNWSSGFSLFLFGPFSPGNSLYDVHDRMVLEGHNGFYEISEPHRKHFSSTELLNNISFSSGLQQNYLHALTITYHTGESLG